MVRTTFLLRRGVGSELRARVTLGINALLYYPIRLGFPKNYGLSNYQTSGDHSMTLEGSSKSFYLKLLGVEFVKTKYGGDFETAHNCNIGAVNHASTLLFLFSKNV